MKLFLFFMPGFFIHFYVGMEFELKPVKNDALSHFETTSNSITDKITHYST